MPPRKNGKPKRIRKTPAHLGVGGSYRVPHRRQTRSSVKAIVRCGRTRLASLWPHVGQHSPMGKLLMTRESLVAFERLSNMFALSCASSSHDDVSRLSLKAVPVVETSVNHIPLTFFANGMDGEAVGRSTSHLDNPNHFRTIARESHQHGTSKADDTPSA